MSMDASSLQAFGQGVATTAFNIARVSSQSATRVASTYESGPHDRSVRHRATSDSTSAPIDAAREMVDLMTAERAYDANAASLTTQDSLTETALGLIVDKRV